MDKVTEHASEESMIGAAQTIADAIKGLQLLRKHYYYVATGNMSKDQVMIEGRAIKAYSMNEAIEKSGYSGEITIYHEGADYALVVTV